MLPPTREEINIYDSLDERCAARDFLGKDVNQAAEMFRQNLCRFEEHLMCMGPVAFRYYIRSVIQVVCSGTYRGEVIGLAGALQFRLEYEPDELVPVCIPLAALCDYIVTHWNELSIDVLDEDTHYEFIELRDCFRKMNQS